MAQQGKKVTMRIIDCKQVYHGHNKKGDEYTIHEVRAAKIDGELINEKLRSFSMLPVGQTIEVTVVPFNSEQHGKSFTLYPTSSKSGGGTTAQVNELTTQVEQQREMIQKLAERVTTLERDLATAVGGKLMAAVDAGIARGLGQDPTTVSDLDAKFGADPPFE